MRSMQVVAVAPFVLKEPDDELDELLALVQLYCGSARQLSLQLSLVQSPPRLMLARQDVMQAPHW